MGSGVLALMLGVSAALTAGAESLLSFELKNWDGRAVSSDSLRGKATIVAFTYAKCVLACPVVTARLKDLDDELGAPGNLRYVLVSVNPADDSAEEILSYLEKHGIDPRKDGRWLFLNGPEEAIARFLTDSQIRVKRTPVEGGHLVEHTIRVLVVGPDGKTAASFNNYFWGDEEIKNVVRSLVGSI